MDNVEIDYMDRHSFINKWCNMYFKYKYNKDMEIITKRKINRFKREEIEIGG